MGAPPTGTCRAPGRRARRSRAISDGGRRPRLYRAAIVAVDDHARRSSNNAFAALGVNAQDELLHALEDGTLDLGDVSAKTFFPCSRQKPQEVSSPTPLSWTTPITRRKLKGLPGPRYNYDSAIRHYGGDTSPPPRRTGGGLPPDPHARYKKTPPPVDVVLVGFGWTAAIMGQELTEAGLNVVAIERGKFRDTVPDFATTFDQDELRYYWRHDLFQSPARETLSFRNSIDQTALPMRHLGSFLPGLGRRRRRRALERPDLALPAGRLRCPLAHDPALRQELHSRRHDDPGLGRHLRRARAALRPLRIPVRHLRQGRQPRRQDPAGRQSVRRAALARVSEPAARAQPIGRRCSADAATELGYQPVPVPGRQHLAGLHQPARRAAGPLHLLRLLREVRLRQLFEGQRADDDPAGADGEELHLRTECEVTRVNLDASGKRATGVTYVDARGKEFEQPADLVVLCAFAQHNVRLLLLSGIGKPYDPQSEQRRGRPQLRLPDHVVGQRVLRRHPEPVHGRRRARHGDRRVQRRQLRPRPGGLHRRRLHRLWQMQTGGRPIETHPVPEGTPLGRVWKRARRRELPLGDVDRHARQR